MSAFEELRRIITEHIAHQQHKDRALVLLDTVVTEERRRGAAGSLQDTVPSGGSGASSGSFRNGEMAGATSSSFGADGLPGGNG
eukprot:1195272-Rhodomonas_salina.1